MDKINWSDKYSVQIPSIDEQHKKFLDLLNRLNSELVIETDPVKHSRLLKLMLTEFEDYALYHFIYEEEHFIMYDYPGAKEHILAHDGFRIKINQLIPEVNTPGADIFRISKELAEYSLGWIETHLENMDKDYIDCFKSHHMK